jgi:hypothetical protein
MLAGSALLVVGILALTGQQPYAACGFYAGAAMTFALANLLRHLRGPRRLEEYMVCQRLPDAEAHRVRHQMLHMVLDELLADFIMHTGRRPSETPIMVLVQWPHRQTEQPDEPPEAKV